MTTAVLQPALRASELRSLCLDLGADDVGFVSIDRAELDDQRDHILAAFPPTTTLISFVLKMNREPIRTPARSAANLEFHHVGDEVNEVSRRITSALEAKGIRALNIAMGFPMEADNFPGRLWVVSHKPVAVAAGLGQMGIHRNLIHPKFGNFVLLGTVLVGAPIDQDGVAIDFDPCVSCKLCVAACPVGAISKVGEFDFSACYTHNYREFMGGFTDWVEDLADSGSAKAYRAKYSDAESTSMWQSLSFGANYKAAYCMGVCPAGDDVIGAFKLDKGQFVREIVKPLEKKVEPVYVVKGSDAELHVKRRFPHKMVRYVGNSLRPSSVEGFLSGLKLVFQRVQAQKVHLRYHFTFVGREQKDATVLVEKGKLEVLGGHLGKADLHVRADSETWAKFLRKDVGLVSALLRRKIRLKGNPKHLLTFAKCFLG